MAYSDIYNKFLIEYDKQNITSSYPSLLKKEICQILDKAYLALITQKFTGNNTRKAAFGIDAKQTIDLQGLITEYQLAFDPENNRNARYPNEYIYKMYPILDEDFYTKDQPKLLYFINGSVSAPNDGRENLVLISPEASFKYGVTVHNKPIIKTPAFFIKEDELHLFVDPYRYADAPNISIQYIREPEKFDGDEGLENTNTIIADVDFQLNDAAAEELINLAVIFALENVESQRTNSKITVSQMEG